MSIRTAAVSLICAAALFGCSSTDTGSGTDHLDPSAAPRTPSEQSQIYSAVLHQLILEDGPFAGTESPVGYVYIVDGAASRSSELLIAADGPAFGTELKNEIAAQSDALPPVEFVTDVEQRADPGRQGLTGVENDGVVVGLAPPRHQDDGTIHVGTGLWCGIDCGIGLTYILDNVAGQWTVTATSGTVSIS